MVVQAVVQEADQGVVKGSESGLMSSAWLSARPSVARLVTRRNALEGWSKVKL